MYVAHMLFVMLKNDFIIYKDPMDDLYAYLPLSSCPGMTISSFAMTLRGRGSRTLHHNDANFLKIVWKCPLNQNTTPKYELAMQSREELYTGVHPHSYS